METNVSGKKNLAEQSRELRNSTHILPSLESNPSHVGERHGLSHCANPVKLDYILVVKQNSHTAIYNYYY